MIRHPHWIPSVLLLGLIAYVSMAAGTPTAPSKSAESVVVKTPLDKAGKVLPEISTRPRAGTIYMIG